MRSSCLAAVSCLPPVPAAGQTGCYYCIEPVGRPQAGQQLFVIFLPLQVITDQTAYLCRGVLLCAVLNDGLYDICHVPDHVLTYNGGWLLIEKLHMSSVRTIIEIEQGHSNPRFETVALLAKELNISLDAIVFPDTATDTVSKTVKDFFAGKIEAEIQKYISLCQQADAFKTDK